MITLSKRYTISKYYLLAFYHLMSNGRILIPFKFHGI